MRPLGKTKRGWSPKTAYAIGLLVADGNLSPDGRHIDFTSKDRELVELFSECLGREDVIRKKSSTYTGEKRYYHVQFSDVLFYRWLQEQNITPNKSKSIQKVSVPKEYFRDFLRGYYDGDGSMYAYWDSRWHSSYMYYFQLTSGSKDFLKWMQGNIEDMAEAQGRLGDGTRAYQLSFAKKATRKIHRFIYYKESVPCLKRKLVKAQEIFRIDDTHNCSCASAGIGRRSRLRA